jgi:phosphohistidine phosphatase
MKILLVRRAAALAKGTPGVLDAERFLTVSGKAKFRVAARGLARIVPHVDVLMTSPLARAQETAVVAASAFHHGEPAIESSLAGASVDAIIAALQTHPCGATVALVGHEPLLGSLLARLLGATEAKWLVLEKGGAALLDLPSGPSTPGRLLWLLPPRVLRALGAKTRSVRRGLPANDGGVRTREIVMAGASVDTSGQAPHLLTRALTRMAVTGIYLVRDVPRELQRAARARAVNDTTTLRRVLLQALREYAAGHWTPRPDVK